MTPAKMQKYAEDIADMHTIDGLPGERRESRHGVGAKRSNIRQTFSFRFCCSLSIHLCSNKK